jgi:hypothetical protein
MKQSRFERAKKVGMISYISKIPNGVEADAVLRGVADSGNRAGWDPHYDFVMEIHPEEGDSFETKFRRIIPAGLVPNFQLGRRFRVLYDPEDHSQVSFISCLTETGEILDFRSFPLRLKKMEDTEMEPLGSS